MKNYLYLICISMVPALHALSVLSPIENFKQELDALQSQCAGDRDRFVTEAQHMIIQREKAIKNDMRRQRMLEKLHAQLNDENDDSQDAIPIKSFIPVMGSDYKNIPKYMRDTINDQYNKTYTSCHMDVVSNCAHEKAYLAYLFVQQLRYINGKRQGEINELQERIAATPAE